MKESGRQILSLGMLATALLSSSSSLKSSSTMTTSTSTGVKTTEQQLRTLIPVTTSDGSKLFVSGPCIVLKTQTQAPTVAQQMQALRPLLKAETMDMEDKKPNDSNNNNNNNNVLNNNTMSRVEENSENEPEPLRCKRRIDFTSLGLPRPQPAAMARRNERERNRVKQVNLGFETLRQHVPQGRKNKKLSKVDTLKEAAKYIKYLHQLLVQAESDDSDTIADTISDTITMVSRPCATTTTISRPPTITTPPPPPAVTTLTSSTNTTSMTSTELLQLTSEVVENSVSTQCVTNNSGINDATTQSMYEVDNVDVKLEQGQTNVMDLSLMRHLETNHQNIVMAQRQQQHQHLQPTKATSTANFLELTPAHLHFTPHHLRHHHLSPSTTHTPMDLNHIPVSIDPQTDLSTLPNIFSSPSSMSFMDYSTTPSSDCAPGVPHTYMLKVDQMSRRSEGSCPVSPSESSGVSDSPEECLGVSEGETWQDLSSDIAEWLCSKIDIDDPDVFI